MPTIFGDKVVVGSVEFNGVAPESGVRLGCDILDGWDDSPDPMVNTSFFGYSDGVSSNPRWPLKERYIEIGGWAETYDRASEERMMALLRRTFQPDVRQDLVRHGPTPQRYEIRASTRVEFTDQMGGAGFRWHCQVMAEWPYRLGTSVKSYECGVFTGTDMHRVYDNDTPPDRSYTLSGGKYVRTYITPVQIIGATGISDHILATNLGDSDAYPVMEIQGYLPGKSWYVKNETTGDSFYFGSPIPTGSILRVDSRYQTATMGAVAVDYYLRGTWISLAPGDNLIRLVSAYDSSEARLRIATYDTWR